jgi:hypothetical protein
MQVKLVVIRIVSLFVVIVPCVIPVIFASVTVLGNPIIALFVDIVFPCILAAFLIFGGPYERMVNNIYIKYI